MKRGAKLAALVTAVVMILSACGKVPSGTQGSDKSGGTQIKKEKSPYADTVIEWKEPVLEDAVREILQKPNGDIRGEELEDITELSLSGTGIYDTDDLIYFVNLETLDLSDNHITELPDLSQVKNLKQLDLSQNEITDLDFAAHLPFVKELNLENNRIRKLDGLAGCTALEVLDLSDNRISSLAPLSALMQLRRLDVGISASAISPEVPVKEKYQTNSCTDFSALAGLTGLEALCIDRLPLWELSELTALSGLRELSMAQMPAIYDLSPLAQMTGLKKLDISSCKAKDFSPIASLVNLEELSAEGIYQAPVETSIAPLKNLRTLAVDAELGAWIGGLVNLEQLSGLQIPAEDEASEYIRNLKNLRRLEVKRCENTQCISGLEKLEYLSMETLAANPEPLMQLPSLKTWLVCGTDEQTQFPPMLHNDTIETVRFDSVHNTEDIASLAGLTAMKDLTLQNNALQSCDMLSGMTGLRRLDLCENIIDDLSGLAGLTNLEELDLSDNDILVAFTKDGLFTEPTIGDISPLGSLTKLQKLSLCAKDCDMSTLKNLPELKELAIYRVQDISSLAGITAPESLTLEYAADLSALASAVNLKKLRVDALYGGDLSALAGMNRLQEVSISAKTEDLEEIVTDTSMFCGKQDLEKISLNAFSLTDLSGLSDCKKLREMHFEASTISGATMPKLPAMRSFTLHGCGVGDSAWFSQMPHLRTLDLYSSDMYPYWKNQGQNAGAANTGAWDSLPENEKRDFFTEETGKALSELRTLYITDIWEQDCAMFAAMPQLQQLTIKQMRFTDCAFAADLKNLRSMDLYGTLCTDLTPLAGLENLEELNIGREYFEGNPEFFEIQDLSALSGLKNLSYLNLNGTQISDISALGSLAGLRVLEMEQVPVKQTGSLSALCELRYFSAPDSWIADASGLAGLEKLEYLALEKGGRMQSATDIEPLKTLVHCQKMQVCAPTAEERSELTSALPHCEFVTGYLHS